MIALVVEPEDDESELLGKVVSTLQSDVDVTESRISGNLEFIDDYTEFSGDPALQSGHYLALKFEATEGATVTIQLIGGEVVRDPVELDIDMNAVLRITDPSKQKLKVVATKADYTSVTKIYTLSGLRLQPGE